MVPDNVLMADLLLLTLFNLDSSHESEEEVLGWIEGSSMYEIEY